MVVFEELFFESNGEPITYNSKELVLIDRIIGLEEVKLQLRFIEINSNWRQGVIIDTKGVIKVSNQEINNCIILWEDTSPKVIEIEINSASKEIFIYNAWDVGNGTTHYWHNGAAMYIEQEENKQIYYCNDGFPDDDLNDLIFEIKMLSSNYI